MGRTRRSAAETREEILSVAQRILQRSGPASIRLDEVGAELGISRQAILHHFGSRAGLIRAVVERAWLGLFSDLSELSASTQDLGPEALVDVIDEVVRARGNARLGAWLLLSNSGLDPSVFQDALAHLPNAVSQGNSLFAGQSQEEARDGLLLIAAALFGDAIFGERLRQALGAPDGESERRRFRNWMVQALTQPPQSS